jgi:SAM-dependent methyltransferase
MLVSGKGEQFPVVDGIPRFVASDGYAAAFGLEWKTHPLTQLDSVTGARISQERLERCLGRPVSELKGLSVLEAGCGAGRFTELLVKSGALVHALDRSVAVEANKGNIGQQPNYSVAQADLLHPPFPPASFDLVLCLGVLQHTPSPEASIRGLWQMVKPGGWLVIDHYTWSFSLVTKLAPLYRLFLKDMPPAKSKRITDRLVSIFFPLHWRVRNLRPAQMLLSRVSPCLVYLQAFPQLGREQHYEWCRLDTYDSLTDYYKHLRTTNQIRATLASLHAQDIWVSPGGNGVEARCRKSESGERTV